MEKVEQMIGAQFDKIDQTSLAMKSWRQATPCKRNGEDMVSLRKRIVAHWMARPCDREEIEIRWTHSTLAVYEAGVLVLSA